MVDFRSVVRRWSALALVSAAGGLVSCGGGGDPAADAAAQEGRPPPALGAVVRLSLASDNFIRRERMQEDDRLGATLRVRAEGDVSRLQNQTIHVVVEDPAGMFQATPRVELLADPPTAMISLDNRPMAVAGRVQGELKVHVCLDAACQSELVGSPMTQPFDVMVHAGFEVDRDTIAIALPFGEVPAPQTVRVKLPPDIDGEWFVEQRPRPNEPAPFVKITQDTSADRSSGTLSLSIAPGSRGTGVVDLQLSASVAGQAARKTVSLRYDVLPNPDLRYVFFPAAGNFTKVFGDVFPDLTGQPMVAQVPTQFMGVEYLSQPPEANGHLLAGTWYDAGFPHTITVCRDANVATCLPPGKYVARLRYRVEGLAEDAYWPVTLDILPP